MGNTREIDTSGFKDLYPFQSHFFDRNGLKMHYLDEGQGPAVVMVHGNPTWSFYYRNLVTCLSREYRTIVPDHIGCGLSDKPQNGEYDYRYKSRVADLEALLDHLVPDGPITLIVHDWGGPIGLAWALGRPERISRLVITNTAAFLAIEGKTVPWQLRLIRNVAPAATLLVQGFNAFSRGALYMAAKRPLSREVKQGLTAPYNSWSNRLATLRFVQDIPLYPQDPGYDLLAWVDQNLLTLSGRPMMILWGEQDFVFDMAYLSEWKKRFPEAEVHTYPEAGHYLLEDEPDQTARQVEAFLQNNPI
jgi:pimeloyl-ACP methyl ester carboxylesterase